MDYEAKQPVYFPVTDFLALEFHLMDTRPGMKPEAFVTDLVKRWLTRDMERLALAAMARRCAVFNGSQFSCPTAPSCEPAMVITSSLPR